MSLGWGIIGCGRVAANHAWAARECGLDLLWACDVTYGRAAAIAHRFGVRQVTTRISDLEADPSLACLVIATDHASHLSIARRFLNTPVRGILIEKPLCTPDQDDLAFAASVVRSRKTVGLVSQHRFRPHVRHVRKILKDGGFGRIELIRATSLTSRDDSYYRDSGWRGTLEQEGGSALINQGYHALDTLVHLFGRPNVRSARMWTQRTQIIEGEEGYHAQLAFGDCPADLHGSNAGGQVWDVVIEICGSAGHVIFDLNHPGGIREITCTSHPVEPDPQPAVPGIDYYGTSHREAVADFAVALMNGHSPTVTVVHAQETLSVIRDIYRTGGRG